MNADRKLLIALLVGFCAGFVVHAAISVNRYMLKESGHDAVVYKLDTRTGETWLVTPQGQSPLK